MFGVQAKHCNKSLAISPVMESLSKLTDRCIQKSAGAGMFLFSWSASWSLLCESSPDNSLNRQLILLNKRTPSSHATMRSRSASVLLPTTYMGASGACWNSKKRKALDDLSSGCKKLWTVSSSKTQVRRGGARALGLLAQQKSTSYRQSSRQISMSDLRGFEANSTGNGDRTLDLWAGAFVTRKTKKPEKTTWKIFMPQ